MKTDFFDLEESFGKDYADALVARIKSGNHNWNFRLQRMAFDLPEEKVKLHQKLWNHFGGVSNYEDNVLTISFCYGHGLPKPMALAFCLMVIDIYEMFDDIDLIVKDVQSLDDGSDDLGVCEAAYEKLKQEAAFHYSGKEMTLNEYFGMDNSEASDKAVSEVIAEKMFDLVLEKSGIHPDEYWLDWTSESILWHRIDDWEKEANHFDDVAKAQKADEAYWASLERGEIR